MKASKNLQKQLDFAEKMLAWFASDINDHFIPKCSWCGKIASIQTAKGKYAQENLHRPCNWGWYCKKCYDKGSAMEREAIYG